MSTTPASNAAVTRLMAEAPDEASIDLSIGEPDQKAPQTVVEATSRALREGATGYTAKPGLKALREALAEDLESCTGVPTDDGDITVTIGGSEAVAVAMMAACSPTRPIVIPDPAWPNYKVLAEELRIPVHHYAQGPSGDDFLDLTGIEEGLKAGARLVVVNSPSNPTAAVASADALASLAPLLERYDAYALSDEAYESIVFSGGRAASLYQFVPGRTFVVRTFSKTYSMTGFRVGSVVTPKPFHNTVGALHGVVTGCAMAAAQHAALVALQELPERGAELGSIYAARFTRAAEILGAWMPPSDPAQLGGFYLWIDGRASGRSSAELVENLRKRGVIVSDGLVYTGTDGFIRASLGADEEDLDEALRTIRQVLDGEER